ncbi:MAG: hypothetical protein ACRCV0_04920 [Brevinema sp.]
MKKLLIALLLSQNMLTAKDLSEAEIQKLKNGIETGDYSVLEPFVTREDLSVYSWIANGQAVVKTLSGNVDNVLPTETVPFSYKKAGSVKTYINQYKMEFINDQEILWDLEEIKKLPHSICLDFYDVMKKAFEAKESEEILKLYDDYNNGIFHRTVDNLITSMLYFIEDKYGIPITDAMHRKKTAIFQYLFEKMYPTKEQQRIFFLNLPLNYVGMGGCNRLAVDTFEDCNPNKNKIEIPYNQHDPFRECDKRYEENDKKEESKTAKSTKRDKKATEKKGDTFFHRFLRKIGINI